MARAPGDRTPVGGWPKRAFDFGLAGGLCLLLWPLGLAIAGAILALDGRPVLFASERIRAPGQPFTLWKFRTMAPGSDDGMATGGEKRGRVTALGRWLRRTRLDELPQVVNILRGDMSFVGPRPPLRRYAELFPDLYARVLRARPGLTGLATLLYHRREAALLSACASAAESDAIYRARCVPAKARLDRIYLKRQSLAFDLGLLWRTLRRVALGAPRPARRPRTPARRAAPGPAGGGPARETGR